MRVDSRSPINLTGTAASKSARGGRGFSISEEAAPSKSAATTSAASPLGLDAVLALQGERQSGQERRKRASRRGHQLLDALDQLKLSVLDGRVTGSQLAALRRSLADARSQSGDAALDEILEHIELRAEVELAKLSRKP